MKPIGPLMREHRLIERMVNILEGQQKLITEKMQVNSHIIEIAVDFFQTYGGRTHHGKEEEILFRDLAKKPLSSELKTTMQELIEEHALSGRINAALHQAIGSYSPTNSAPLNEIKRLLGKQVNLYHDHIKKEDERFFYPILVYLSEEEQNNMLAEFREFDRKLIHEKYQRVVEETESGKTQY
jgi:hemerythrin-like domain-containing protein